ncbi:MAG: SUMF1/EgtB/PvdO family nonheme iron enzyme [Thermoguttaceae bacterium]|nr:SUMF1/EgtB/PvdO family nonheme iron enzyme [Thermoguttaceae bacterium]
MIANPSRARRAFALGAAVFLTLFLAATSALAADAAPSLDAPAEPGARIVLNIGGAKWAFRYCPAGTFVMGSPETEQGRAPDEARREVELDAFWILETEVTQAMWVGVFGENPSRSKGARLPVESVSWDDCQKFVAQLNSLGVLPTGWEFALPRESQWEYACRAGSSGATYGELDAIAWHQKNSKFQIHAVASKKPNAWGVYDTLGNVREWCEFDKGSSEAKDDRRPERGGSLYEGSNLLRAANRNYSVRNARFSLLGLRLALVRNVAPTPAPIEESTTEEAPLEFARDSQAFNGEKTPGDRAVLTLGGVEVAFRYCPSGAFIMGSPEDEEGRDDDEVLHKVNLTRGYWTMETEATQAFWEAATGSNPSKVQGANRPVDGVSWNDCDALTAKLNAAGVPPEGWEFALPTESQWEYACRAGTTGARYGELSEIARGRIRGGERFDSATDVGTKAPNPWGLYDALGNVWEWCADRSGDYPTDETINPVGSRTATLRVLRGGAWNGDASVLRAANRGAIDPEERSERLGVRFVLVPKE